MAFTNEQLLIKALDLTSSAVSDAGDKSITVLNNPDIVAEFIQVVYEKLVDINDSLD